MSAHTPGPWSWSGEITAYGEMALKGRDGKSIAVQSDGDECLRGNARKDGPEHLRAKADWALIAAAPDLLAALEQIVKRLTFDCSECAVDYAEQIARAALAKARDDE